MKGEKTRKWMTRQSEAVAKTASHPTGTAELALKRKTEAL